MRWMLPGCYMLCLLAGLAGCQAYNYQPTPLMLPLADTTGEVDAYVAKASSEDFQQWAGGAHAVVGRHTLIGLEGSRYFAREGAELAGRRSPLPFGPREDWTHERLQRGGYSVGLGVGQVYRQGRKVFSFMGGLAYEHSYRDYVQRSDTFEIPPAATQVHTEGHYMKRWLQGGLSVSLLPPQAGISPADIRLVTAVRVNIFNRLRGINQIDSLAGRQRPDLLAPAPSAQDLMLDAMVGLEATLLGVQAFIHAQASFIEEEYGWHHAPGWSGRAGVGLCLGRRWRIRKP